MGDQTVGLVAVISIVDLDGVDHRIDGGFGGLEHDQIPRRVPLPGNLGGGELGPQIVTLGVGPALDLIDHLGRIGVEAGQRRDLDLLNQLLHAVGVGFADDQRASLPGVGQPGAGEEAIDQLTGLDRPVVEFESHLGVGHWLSIAHPVTCAAVAADKQSPDRNLALELVRVTEAAALAASRWMGRGDKEGADQAAVDAMRVVLATVPMDGIVVIGEGEKDEAPMLYNGETIGDGSPPATDIAVDPIDGTTLTSLGRGNALAVIAVSERGSMFDPGPCVYMEKIAVGPAAVGRVDLNASPVENLKAVAEAKGEGVHDVTAVILDRDRHLDLIDDVRAAGARIRLIPDGDVAGAISTAWSESGADILFGIGGTPEGVITAAALKCMGGEMQGRLWPRNEAERKAAEKAGYDVDRVLSHDDLMSSENCFFSATGVTDGELLKGVHYDGSRASTQSLVMRSKSGTVRLVNATHQLDRLTEYSSVPYD